MASTFQGLTDLILINNKNLADYEVTDLLDDAPFLRALAADLSSNGTKHQYLKEVDAPVVGFRAINEGRDHDKSTDVNVTIDLKILDAGFTVDTAFADIYRYGPAAYLAREGFRHLKAAFFHAEKQLIYGTDADGFVGMADAEGLDNAAHDMVLSAGASSARSSVWMVRSVDDFRDATVILGQDGEINWGDSQIQRVEDGDGKYYFAYTTPIQGWLALQFGSKYSIARYANLGTDESSTGDALNDKRLSELLELFPSQRPPSMILMNRRSLGQLQRSRTATNATGREAPRPTDYEGIPIVLTDAITNNESAVPTTTTTTTTAG